MSFSPSYRGSRINVRPLILCSINTDILGELGSPCLLGSLFPHFCQGFYIEVDFHNILGVVEEI